MAPPNFPVPRSGMATLFLVLNCLALLLMVLCVATPSWISFLDSSKSIIYTVGLWDACSAVTNCQPAWSLSSPVFNIVNPASGPIMLSTFLYWSSKPNPILTAQILMCMALVTHAISCLVWRWTRVTVMCLLASAAFYTAGFVSALQFLTQLTRIPQSVVGLSVSYSADIGFVGIAILLVVTIYVCTVYVLRKINKKMTMTMVEAGHVPMSPHMAPSMMVYGHGSRLGPSPSLPPVSVQSLALPHSRSFPRDAPVSSKSLPQLPIHKQ